MGDGRDRGDIPALTKRAPRFDDTMNRAFLIIGIPAFIVSFCWLAFGWGWRVAAIVSGVELAVAVGAVVYLIRRENARPSGPESSG